VRKRLAEARAELAVRWVPPLVVLAFFAATVGGYGIFRDELYYFACARHLDWGYVDHPPMIALLAALVRALFGESWGAARLLSAAAAAGTVLLVGDTAREVGGGRWARLLAQLLCATTPVYLALFSIFSMNAFDVLVWAGLARIAARILAGGSARPWLAFGALAGLGLENKLDVGLLGGGVAVGLVLARRVDVLRSRWLWLGGAVAIALFLPNVAWQVRHGWPTREFVANAQHGKIAYLGPLGFVAAQFRDGGPIAFTLALAGLGWLLASRGARPFRPLGWAVLTVLAVFAASVSKPYYFAPALTVLFAAAGVAVESWTAGRFARPARAVVLVAAASVVVAAPLAKPLLSEDNYVRYAAALGIGPSGDENHRLGRLPQFFADMHGWHDLARAVAGVAAALPPEDRAQACVYGTNYGEAGAIDFFRPELGLPPAISAHNSYWLWGPGSCTGAVLLIIGGKAEGHARHFASVEAGGVFRCPDCMPFEDNLTIWVARGPRAGLGELWGKLRRFI
jgi:hypothetical protein